MGDEGEMRTEAPSHNVGHQFRKCMSVCQKQGRGGGRLQDCKRLINEAIKIINAVLKACHYMSQTEERRNHFCHFFCLLRIGSGACWCWSAPRSGVSVASRAPGAPVWNCLDAGCLTELDTELS